MFALALFVGIYSYVIFVLGILGLLYKNIVIGVTVLFLISVYFYFRREPREFPRLNLKKREIRPFLFLFLLTAGVNLVGALGPELSFDSLWYHLTLPKIFLQNHSINYIPGGLFYYSLMPKLGEMLYVAGLSFGSEVIPKLIHFAFGILTSIAVYKITRKFTDQKYAFLSVLIFYGSIVVAWESTTGYIDLIRTFFEAMALWGIVEFIESRKRTWLLESSVMAGLAISTKLTALGSIPIFIALLFIFEKNKILSLKNSAVFIFISFLIPFPWFFMSFLETGNPIYPFFSSYFKTLQSSLLGLDLVNPLNFIKTFLNQFLFSNDPISPMFIISIPLALFLYKRNTRELKILLTYSVLGIFIWYLFAKVEGSRFILPYLPAFSVISALMIAKINQIVLKKYLVLLVIFICSITIFYRGAANFKYIPVILGMETKDEFLTNNLNFKFGDFYDTDGFFKENIKDNDNVLLYGFHNLYYADFPFIHESYVKKGNKFNYIATQNTILPKRFSHWELIYQNNKTNVSVYRYGGMMWSY